MSLKDLMKMKGWHISDSGLNELLDGKTFINVDQMIAKILNVDLKEYGTKCLPSEISRGKIDKFDGNIVLQINHIRNINQPKSFEKDLLSSTGGAQLLRVQMTDGTSSCYGLTLSNVFNLCLDVPPGTKIYLKPTEISVKQGFIFLDNSVCKVLGGKVQHLVDKWELSRNAVNSARKRTGGQDGNRPPPWVPFGHNINSNINTKGKALDANNSNTQGKENVEFYEQRKAVIAEALRTKEVAHKKTFSTSGVKQVGSTYGSGANDKKAFVHDSRQITSHQNDNSVNLSNKIHHANVVNKNTDKKDKNVEAQVSSKPSGPSTLFDFLSVKMSLDETGVGNVGTSNSSTDMQSNHHNKKPYNTQQIGNFSHQTNRFPIRKQPPNNSFQNQKQYGERQPESGMRKHYSEKKFIPKNDQQNHQVKQKFGSSYHSTKHNTNDANVQSLKSLHQDPNYQRQYPSLDRNQESNFKNRSELCNTFQKSFNDSVPNYDHCSSEANKEQYFSRDSKYHKPASNSSQKSFSKNNFKNKYREGESVLAKYWEDNKYYPAIIHGTSTHTCVVQFLGFMNYEEVLYSDVYQSNCENYSKHDGMNDSGNNSFSSSQNFEFRRGGKGRQYADSKWSSTIPHKNQKPTLHQRFNTTDNGVQQQNNRNPPVRQLYVPPAQRSQH